VGCRAIHDVIRCKRGQSQGLGRIVFATLLFGLLLLPGHAAAHDIPDQILLSGFLKPEGDRLHLVVRIPLVMFLNMNFPKRGTGFLALDQIEQPLTKAAAAIAREILIYENNSLLKLAGANARISRPSDRSFETYETALENINGPPLEPEINVFWNQGYVDAHLEYAIHSARSNYSMDFQVTPGLKNRLTLMLRLLLDDDRVLAYELHPAAGLIFLNPRWYQAAWTFVKLGYTHILDGVDHLLFLLCLVAPFRLRHIWTLVAVVTSFTLAHSVTLIAAALGLVPQGDWFPPLVEILIALSILYMAVDNVILAELKHRWRLTALFGLIHGFGFSFVLQQDLQFAGSHFLLSLLSFNLGVEIGQLLFLLAVVPILSLITRGERLQRYILILLSVLAGHTAWHWTVERFETLRLKQASFFGQIDWGVVLIWGVAVSLVGMAVWLLSRHGTRRVTRQPGAGK
jgi:hypothetical protein